MHEYVLNFRRSNYNVERSQKLPKQLEYQKICPPNIDDVSTENPMIESQMSLQMSVRRKEAK